MSIGEARRGAGPALAVLLERTREDVDRVLAELPENRLQARRVITREWGFTPRPEQLQTIERIANDPVGQGGLRDLSRATLAMTVLVDHELRELLDSQELDPRRAAWAAEILPGLAEAVRTLEEEVRSALETVAFEEREFLLQVGNALIPDLKPLDAAGVLVPRLARLAGATGSDDLRSAAPSLTDEEIAALSAFFCHDASGPNPADRSGDGPSRVSIDAIVLRSLIEESLAERGRLREQPVDDPEALAARRKALTERLEQEKQTYHVVCERLQQHQDTALVASLHEFAESLRRVQRALFSTYLKLAKALSEGLESPEAVKANVDALLEESSKQDALAERTRKVTRDELYLNALKDVRLPEKKQAAIAVQNTYDRLRRERLRMRVLVPLASVLAVACVVYYSQRLSGGEDPLKLPMADLPDTLILTDPIAAGPMMYAKVSHWSWDHMSDKERMRSVLELGQAAADQGYDLVCLVDEQERELARWSKTHGAALAERPTESEEPPATPEPPTPQRASTPKQ